MKINELHIRGLFGIYDYNIRFNDPLTIITGPNGYGKTTILRMVEAISPEKLYYFYILKFKSLKFLFDNSDILEIQQEEVSLNDSSKNIDDEAVALEKIVNFKWRSKIGSVCRYKYNKRNIEQAKTKLEHKPSDFPWSFEEETEDPLTSEKFNRNIALANGGNEFMLMLNTIKSSFITANRIYKEKDRSPLPIKTVVANLRDKLRETQIDYLTTSEELDKQFISTVLNPSLDEYTEEEYEAFRKKVESKYRVLKKYGITKSLNIPDYQADNKVLYAYLKYQAQKISVCDEVMAKFELMSRLLEKKKFAHKSFVFTPEHGVRPVSDNGDFLDVEQLSSGEQHEIVLLYDMIFENEKNSILLVDEPENSLHVAWQKDFVEDLIEIASQNDFQAIIATHSPTVVAAGNYVDIDLYSLQES